MGSIKGRTITPKMEQGFKDMKKTVQNQFKNGRVIWNKGLTKATSEGVRKNAKGVSMTRKKLFQEGKLKCFGHGISPSMAGELNFWFGKDRSGALNPNWQGGKSAEPYAPEWNERLREKVRTKFKRICQLCGKLECDNEWGKLQVHHIDYNKKNCKINNLIPLCVGCNFKVNYQRILWTKHFQDKFEEMLK